MHPNQSATLLPLGDGDGDGDGDIVAKKKVTNITGFVLINRLHLKRIGNYS